jgi:hypothetical protein
MAPMFALVRLVSSPAQAVGAGFDVTAGDLNFIIKQIKIAEPHTVTLSEAEPCATLVDRNPAGVDDGIPDSQQVPNRLASFGLRLVDGSCNTKMLAGVVLGPQMKCSRG